ncbi:Pentatricopeptide repeat-containing protein [Apostasia shenzhenica]|uniref:Pentatricopeptide repeat-containing protein n=1 Tax=Apostasia shenzhenica TaxID=1088818 RepID=A0A2I0B7Q3_9ASPA|nr:Pentatricopeptide repeat-containing protein [Apostasia shenzhenica]
MRWATAITFLLGSGVGSVGSGAGCLSQRRRRCSFASSTLARDLSLSEHILTILDTVPAAAIDRPLNCLAPLLSSSSISLALSSAPSLSSAFCLFVWASRNRRLRSFSNHNLVISLLLRDAPSSFSSFWSSLSDLSFSPIVIHPHAFAVLMSAYNAAGLPEKVVEAFSRMPDFASRPNTFTYNTFLHILVRQGMILLAMQIYSQMIKSDCRPNLSTYTILIHGLCKTGEIDDALRLFDEMLQRGMAPNTTVYTVLLSVLCRTNKLDDAIRQFELMKEKNCSPDEIAFNVLLCGLCRAGRLKEAFKQLKLFEEQGYVLGLHGYSCLIDGLFRAQRFEEACRYYNEMLLKNIRPDCILYTIMIRGYTEVGRTEEAFEFLNEMTDRGFVPDTYCYNTLIKGLCDAGFLDRARSLKLEISQNDLFPDSATFTILICGMCKEGLVHEAQQIFDEMGGAGCFPTVLTFNSLINGLCNAGKLNEAQLLFYKMEMGRNPYLYIRLSQGPDRVHDISSLQRKVQESCQSGDFLRAYKLLRSIMDSGVVPDIVTYNILINGMCKAGRIDVAQKLVEELKLKGHSPDVITYSTIIDALSKAHREKEVSEVLEHMLNSGCKPSVSIYNTQMRTLSRKRQISKAIILWLDYLSQEKDYSAAADSIKIARNYFEEGHLVEAIRTLLVMERRNSRPNSFPYTIWLIGLCQERKIDQALGIFTLLRAFNVEATPPSCALLINYLCRAGKLVSALDVMLYSLSKGFLFMKPVGNRLIRRLCMHNKLTDARVLVRRMHLAGYDMDVYLRASTKALLYTNLLSAL